MAHNKELYPEIWAAFETASGKLEKLKAKRKKSTDKIDAIGDEIGALIDKKNELNKVAMEDYDEIVSLTGEVSRLAKAMGAKSLGE